MCSGLDGQRELPGEPFYRLRTNTIPHATPYVYWKHLSVILSSAHMFFTYGGYHFWAVFAVFPVESENSDTFDNRVKLGAEREGVDPLGYSRIDPSTFRPDPPKFPPSHRGRWRHVGQASP